MEMLKKVICLMVVLCMVVNIGPHAAEGAITCGQVVNSLVPCVAFLQKGGAVPPVCCNKVRSLNSAATTTPDRQAACRCLQTASKSIKGINPANASKLPGLCGVKIPYPISTSTDCSKVQ